MKQIIGFFLAMFLGSSIVNAEPHKNYVIQMKDGRHFITDYYWENGELIKFNYLGGIMGFSREKITEIKDTKLPAPREIVTVNQDDNLVLLPPSKLKDTDEKPAEVKPAEVKPAEAKKPETKIEDTSEFQTKDNEYQMELIRIMNERQLIIDAFNSAKKNNDQENMSKSESQLKKNIHAQIKLNQETHDLHKGTLPDWWERIISRY
ncbi:MAG: hypothetical protein HQK77_00495 [Desulfobacterales bacterium]|nr:hypothetical protein [Desulfobacterales bacterium]